MQTGSLSTLAQGFRRVYLRQETGQEERVGHGERIEREEDFGEKEHDDNEQLEQKAYFGRQ
jgi:hypothetical protein